MLFIRLSCYNKPILERFSKLAQKKSWNFSIAFMSLQESEECLSYSAANYAFTNQIYVEDGDKKYNYIPEFVNLESLQDFVKLTNKTD